MCRAQFGVQEGLYRLYGVQFGSSGHNLAVQVGLGSKVKPHRAQFWPPRCLDERHSRMYIAKFVVQEARESNTDGGAQGAVWRPRGLGEQHRRVYRAHFDMQEARVSSIDGCTVHS